MSIHDSDSDKMAKYANFQDIVMHRLYKLEERMIKLESVLNPGIIKKSNNQDEEELKLWKQEDLRKLVFGQPN